MEFIFMDFFLTCQFFKKKMTKIIIIYNKDMLTFNGSKYEE